MPFLSFLLCYIADAFFAKNDVTTFYPSCIWYAAWIYVLQHHTLLHVAILKQIIWNLFS